MVNKAAKRKRLERWLDGNVHKKLLARREEDIFKKRSEQAKKKKRSTTPVGEKIDPGHRQGSISTAALVNKMSHELKRSVNAPEAYLRGHNVKQPDGTHKLVGTKPIEVMARVDELMESSTADGTSVMPNEAFFEAIGGRQRGGGVYGLRSAADRFLVRAPSVPLRKKVDHTLHPSFLNWRSAWNKG